MPNELTKPRCTKGWALIHPDYGLNFASCRQLRRDVVAYANADAAPGWNWARYRKSGWRIIHIEIRLLRALEGQE